MQNDQRPPPGRWWQRGERTRWHAYYAPTSNLQGVLLFLFIALLGGVALAFASLHVFNLGTVRREDGTLGLIGLFCLLLGFYQAWRLTR